MRIRLLAPLLVLSIAFVGGVRAAPVVHTSSCTSAQKAHREAALSAYRKQIPVQRRVYFASHRSATLRRAFVHRQELVLQRLTAAAACTAPPATGNHTARLAELRVYASAVEAVTPLLDPAVTETAEDDLAQITSHEEICETDPESTDCPVPAPEYQTTAKSLRDAAGQFKKLATKLGAIVPPTMSLADYNDAANSAAAECGVDLITIASAHRSLAATATKWETRLGHWADTYAAGKSVDWDTVDYLPGGGSFGDESRDALGLWVVMVNAYWNSLAAAHDVASAPPVPEWISSLAEDECPPPD